MELEARRVISRLVAPPGEPGVGFGVVTPTAAAATCIAVDAAAKLEGFASSSFGARSVGDPMEESVQEGMAEDEAEEVRRGGVAASKSPCIASP
eukprot:SAG11_NODE_10418_length_833_cov_0.975477_1_plen_94_part_00